MNAPRQSTTYAFIGLGELGGAMAACLVRAGFTVHAVDRDRAAVARLVALGALDGGTPAEAARAAGHAITCLPSPTISEAVLTGPDGLLAGLPQGGSWIEMSTNGRDEMIRLAGLAAEAGVDVLECPVTGGVHLARRGAITALIGGDPQLYERHREAIGAMTARQFRMGPIGSAAIIKVITNMLAFIHLVAAGEAMMLARKGGLDLGESYRAIVASSGNSFVHETETQLVLNGSYDVGFSMALALKDLGFASAMAETWQVPLRLEPLVHAIFRQGAEAYGSAAQSTMIVRLLEEATGTDLRAAGFPARLGEPEA